MLGDGHTITSLHRAPPHIVSGETLAAVTLVAAPSFPPPMGKTDAPAPDNSIEFGCGEQFAILTAGYFGPAGWSWVALAQDTMDFVRRRLINLWQEEQYKLGDWAYIKQRPATNEEIEQWKAKTAGEQRPASAVN